MTQHKRSLFLNREKCCPWECDSGRLHSQTFRDQVTTIFNPVAPQVAPGIDIQWAGEGRQKGESQWEVLWATHGSGVYLFCSHSTDHYSPWGSSYLQGRLETYMPRQEVWWIPAESQHTPPFQLANTYFTFFA